MPRPTHFAFADESGDSKMDRIDPAFPVLSFAVCLFEAATYERLVVPAVRDLKLRHFDDDQVVLHEREIRRRLGRYSVMRTPQARFDFEREVIELIEALPFTIIAVVVHKGLLKTRYLFPDDPYELCLRFAFERVRKFVDLTSGTDAVAHLTAESRDPTNDRRLREALDDFRRGDYLGGPLGNVALSFARKIDGHAGLEIADLVANPIARHVLGRPSAFVPFSIIEPKLRRNPQGRIDGWGIKVFP